MTSDVQFSQREVPWSKLGKLVEQPVTAAEAAKLGGLDFTVSLRPIAWINDSTGYGVNPIDSRRAVIRDDTGDFFGIASSTIYSPLQYAEAFNFMDTLNSPYVAAGALRGGRQGFMAVKPDVDFNVLGGDDPHDLYAILRTSHDCSRGIEVSVMPLRGRCMNQMTLRSFSKMATHRWSIKHNTKMTAKLAEAQKSLTNLTTYARRYEQLAQQLADTVVTPKRARNLLEITIPRPSAGKTDRVIEQWQERLTKIMELWSSSPTVAYAGTGWGLVNAVSEYWEWHRAGGTSESRFLNALEGETHKRMNKITGMLLSGVGA